MTLDKVFNLVYQLLTVVVLPVLGIVVLRYVHNDKARKALLAADKFAENIVEELNARKADIIDPANTAEMWNSASAQRLKSSAMASLRAAIAADIPALTSYLGGEAQVNSVLSTIIEGKVQSTKSPNISMLAGAVIDTAKPGSTPLAGEDAK